VPDVISIGKRVACWSLVLDAISIGKRGDCWGDDRCKLEDASIFCGADRSRSAARLLTCGRAPFLVTLAHSKKFLPCKSRIASRKILTEHSSCARRFFTARSQRSITPARRSSRSCLRSFLKRSTHSDGYSLRMMIASSLHADVQPLQARPHATLASCDPGSIDSICRLNRLACVMACLTAANQLPREGDPDLLRSVRPQGAPGDGLRRLSRSVRPQGAPGDGLRAGDEENRLGGSRLRGCTGARGLPGPSAPSADGYVSVPAVFSSSPSHRLLRGCATCSLSRPRPHAHIPLPGSAAQF
jgi:hypothetical protein